eukprot:gene3308-5749_t
MSKKDEEKKEEEKKAGFLTQVNESESHKRKSLDKGKLNKLFEEEIISVNEEEDIYYYNYIEMFEDEDFDPFSFIASLPPLDDPYIKKPPRAKFEQKDKTKMTLVLDLDETLVHCSTEPLSGSDLVFPVVFNGVEYKVFVRKRPGFEDFLKEVSKIFEVIVFTASQQVYADKLLNILDPKKEWIQYRIFRDSCVDVDGNYLKDLHVLDRDLKRTVIVDNSPQAFGFQYDNGIPIESWFEDKTDRELYKLIPFLKKLKDVDDVRPLIRDRFSLHSIIERFQGL